MMRNESVYCQIFIASIVINRVKQLCPSNLHFLSATEQHLSNLRAVCKNFSLYVNISDVL